MIVLAVYWPSKLILSKRSQRVGKPRMKYSTNIDCLFASIVYLGIREYYWARTPQSMANELRWTSGGLTHWDVVIDFVLKMAEQESKESDRRQIRISGLLAVAAAVIAATAACRGSRDQGALARASILE
jgi:hypothetical protein